MTNDQFDETIPSRLEPEDNSSEALEATQLSSAAELEESLAATQPSPAATVDEDTRPPRQSSKSRMWLRRALIGVLIFVAIVAVGALGGYQSGINARVNQQEMQAATEAAYQMAQGLADLQLGNYEQARQRFEYVIRINPQYPGAADYLAQALLALNTTATATTAPTATATTAPVGPDTGDLDTLFQQAQQARTDKDWDTLLSTLDALRGKNPNYRTVEVDGLYYDGLRNRGVDRILVQGNLEGGIFDLNLAEQFGPIDAQASGYRQWAEWYLTGASFWEVNWEQAAIYFGYVAQVAPNLSDSSYFTAQSRLATAQYNYADTLMIQVAYLLDNKEWCQASDLAKLAQSYKALEPEIQSTADFAIFKCDMELGTPEP